jgi:phospholipid-binding lipoprotein MlaA
VIAVAAVSGRDGLQARRWTTKPVIGVVAPPPDPGERKAQMQDRKGRNGRSQPRAAALPAALLTVIALAGCAGGAGTTRGASGLNDPLEDTNRRTHEFNKAFDQTLFGGGGRRGLVPILPDPVARGLSNVQTNLGSPSNVINSVLQGRPGPAVTNTFRFVINTTVGIGGIFDPSTALGLPREDTDVGETLAVWGVGEGAYLEVPFLGPSTGRDFTGTLVDSVLDPVAHVLGRPERYYADGARLGGAIGNRQRFADTFESILYESADSYAQSRLLYLQNRRFELGEETGEDDLIDPYEDPYAE